VFISSNAPPLVAWLCGLVGELVQSLYAFSIMVFDLSNGEGYTLNFNWALDSPNQNLFKPKLGSLMYIFFFKKY